MVSYISIRLAHPDPDWDRQFRFVFVGYEVPADIVDHSDFKDYGEYANWYYVNSNGFAQKYNPARPPSKYPTPGRMILVPAKEEIPFLG